jgi:hypothetical protein
MRGSERQKAKAKAGLPAVVQITKSAPKAEDTSLPALVTSPIPAPEAEVLPIPTVGNGTLFAPEPVEVVITKASKMALRSAALAIPTRRRP